MASGTAAVFDELGVERVEFGLRGQFEVPEQVGDFLERRVVGEVVDVVADVDELAGGAVDVAQRGIEGHDAFEAARLHLLRGRRGGAVACGRGGRGLHNGSDG